MKKYALAILAAVGALFFAPTTSEAGGISIRFGSGPSFGHSYSPRYYSSSRSHYSSRNYVPRVIRTSIINQCRRRYVRYLPCGTPQYYYATRVTYCDHYCNGSRRTYTRTHY
ncbi:MAG: hypothetical protein AAF236_03310 [Verrucomicrobiota bacterium]